MDLRKNIILHLNPWVYVQLHISATSLGDKVMTSIKYNRDFGRSLASGCFPFLDSRSFEERSHVKHLIQSTDILTCFILVSHSSTVAAAAAKSLQSCPTLCDPRDGSPPGSCIHGTFQARVLEWGAIAFSILSTTDL